MLNTRSNYLWKVEIYIIDDKNVKVDIFFLSVDKRFSTWTEIKVTSLFIT